MIIQIIDKNAAIKPYSVVIDRTYRYQGAAVLQGQTIDGEVIIAYLEQSDIEKAKDILNVLIPSESWRDDKLMDNET